MSFIEENGYFVFDGVKSSDYGVWINGGGTFNAPKRRYQEVVIPGRNGVLTLDEGAFEEQEVVYPAFIARNFPANVEAFRNQLMARNGYVRMTDSYHPNEYYMAKYMSGLEVETVAGGKAGSFDLTFRRDPRRFLLTGEQTTTLAASGSITNPTLYASRPLIRVTFSASGELIQLPYYISLNPSTISGVVYTRNDTTGAITANGTATVSSTYTIKNNMPALPAGKYHLQGCPEGGSSNTYKLYFWLKAAGGSAVAIYYDYGDGIDFEITDAQTEYQWVAAINISSGTTVNNIVFQPSLTPISAQGCTLGVGDETITLKNNFPYIDVDSEIQDCYYGLNNANSQVILDNFPTLQPGATGITIGSGISSVEITPRWYII